MKLTPAIVSQLFPTVPIQDIVVGKFSGKEISHIDDISVCIGMRKIDLSSNCLSSNEALSGIQYNKGLTFANLSKNSLSSFDALRNFKKLVVLNVSHNEVIEVPFWLKYIDSLKAVIMNNNKISVAEPSVWAPSSLNTIVLSQNAIESIEGFARCKKLTHLTKLSLSANSIRNVPVLSQSCCSLKELRLAENKISFLLAGCLPPSLEILDLSNNRIEKFSDIEECLKNLPSLVHLSLKGCKICTVSHYEDKIRQLVPSLRILDGVRFDERFLLRKKRKLSSVAVVASKMQKPDKQIPAAEIETSENATSSAAM